MSNDVNFKRAQQLFEMGRYKKAIPYLHKYLVEESNNSESAILMLGWSYVRIKEFEKAIEYAKLMLISDKSFLHGFGHYIFAIYNSHNNKRDKALNAINEALKINPNSEDFLSEKAQIHINRGEELIALKVIESLLQRNPNNVVAFKLKNEIYGNKKSKLKETEHLTKEILRLAPNEADSFKRTANTKLNQGFYEEALYYYNESLQLDPTDNEVILNREVARIQKSSSFFALIDELRGFLVKRMNVLFYVVLALCCAWVTTKIDVYPSLILVPFVFVIFSAIGMNLFSKKIIITGLVLNRETKEIIFKNYKFLGIIFSFIAVISIVMSFMFIGAHISIYAKLSFLSYIFLFQIFLLDESYSRRNINTFLIISNVLAVFFYTSTTFNRLLPYCIFFYAFLAFFIVVYFIILGLNVKDEELE